MESPIMVLKMVLPASAGMILEFSIWTLQPLGAPRIRGDDPA